MQTLGIEVSQLQQLSDPVSRYITSYNMKQVTASCLQGIIGVEMWPIRNLSKKKAVYSLTCQVVLHCVHMYVRMYVCLDRPFTVNCKWVHSNASWRQNAHAYVYIAATADLSVSVKGNMRSEDDKSWMCLQHTLDLTFNGWLCDKTGCGSQKFLASAMHKLPAWPLIHN